MVDLCLHIFNPKHTRPLLRVFAPILDQFDCLLVSTPTFAVEEVTSRLHEIQLPQQYTVIGVDNERNDWSGYLALLRKTQADTFIIGNDSIVNRRLIRRRDVLSLLNLTINWEQPCLVGELDTARVSVPVDGRSSSSWVSSYLFGMRINNKAEQIASWLESRSSYIPENTCKFFMAHLEKSRPELLALDRNACGKLSAMYLERLLTEYAVLNEFDIVSQYGGSWSRKLFKLIEARVL